MIIIKIWLFLAILLGNDNLIPTELSSLASTTHECEWDSWNTYINRLARGLGIGNEDDEYFDMSVVASTLHYRLDVHFTSPPLHALNALPSRKIAEDQVTFADLYIENMKGIAARDGNEDKQKLMAEYVTYLEYRKGIWSNLFSAHKPYRDQWSRREELRDLLKKIGFKNFWEGRMPDVVPFELFKSIDP